MFALPYPDDAFDGLWCASVTQYFSDEELLTALAEFRRVVRPGGLVAVKDIDGNLMRVPTCVPGLISHLREARARAGQTQAYGAMRGPELPAWLRRAGLVDVSSRTTLVERWPPDRPSERQYIGSALATFASMANDLELPESERNEWARLRDLGDAVLDDPDHYYREGHVLVVGRVSDGPASEG